MKKIMIEGILVVLSASAWFALAFVMYYGIQESKENDKWNAELTSKTEALAKSSTAGVTTKTE